MRFVVPGKPQPKQRPRKGKHSWYTPKATRDYEQAIAMAAKCAGAEVLNGPVVLMVWVCFGDRRRRDLDNVVKAIADGLNGVAYGDDSQIWSLHCERIEDGDPRAEVEVLPMEEE